VPVTRERQLIKRIGIVVETQDQRMFTIYSDTAGAEMVLEFEVEDEPWPPYGVLAPPPTRTLGIIIKQLLTWTVTAYDQRAQKDRLESIKEGAKTHEQ
jgi:hypothetical protein